MSSIPIYILPGLDGTDLLLQRFVELAPSEMSVQVIPLPDDPDDNYDSLVEEVLKVIGGVPCHIIAESFSGPIGILLARRFPEVVCRLTLVSSFAQSPTPSFAKFVPWKLLFRMPMPNFVANRYFLGSESALAPMLRKAIGTTSVATLARRIRCVMKVNVSQELSEIACPIDYVWPSNDRLVPLWSVRNKHLEDKPKHVCDSNPWAASYNANQTKGDLERYFESPARLTYWWETKVRFESKHCSGGDK